METLNIGLTIMVIGMSTVFIFFAIMIVVMNISTKIINIIGKYFPEQIEQAPKIKSKNNNEEAKIALAIAAALHKQIKS